MLPRNRTICGLYLFLELDPGMYEAEATADGHTSNSDTIALEGGQIAAVELRLDYLGGEAEGEGEAPTYVLIVSVSPVGRGGVDVDPAERVYTEGTEVTLTAVPAGNWSFDHWEGDLIGADNPATITMDSLKRVTAVFVAGGEGDGEGEGEGQGEGEGDGEGEGEGEGPPPGPPICGGLSIARSGGPSTRLRGNALVMCVAFLALSAASRNRRIAQ